MNASDREALAQRVVDGHRVVCRKLKDMAEDIRRLWSEFDALRPGDSIMGCTNKTQFCVKHLDRELRTVRYMLAGGNHNREKEGENVSPLSECDVKILEAAESGDQHALTLVAAVARGERRTLSSARKCPPIPTECPLCCLQLPSKNQLRKHAKDHGITAEGVKDFLDPDHAIRLEKARNAATDDYQRALVEQTVPVLDDAWKAVNLLLPFNGDGNEHRFVRLMESAMECAARQKPFSEAEQHRRECLVDVLRQAASRLTHTASKLEASVEHRKRVRARIADARERDAREQETIRALTRPKQQPQAGSGR